MEKTALLFDEFAIPSKEEWLARVEKELKGRPIDELNTDWFGIDVQPFFHRSDI
ncbi:MAG: hypothetical protein JJ975_07390, partial [Bacteroidia bacterium]|nr:hypothetical protein [Bacteroidia bacterium]